MIFTGIVIIAAAIRCVSIVDGSIITCDNTIASTIFIDAGAATATATTTATATATNAAVGYIHWKSVYVAAGVIMAVAAGTYTATTASCGFDLRSVNVERIKY